CGSSYRATLRNTVDPPVRMWHNFGENKQKIPTYIIAPATSRGWSQHIPNLKKVIDELIENGNADPQRLYITGFSMGAMGTWDFLDMYPGYFAAAIPMGMGFHGDMKKIKDIPIWTIKGETDWYGRTLNQSVDSIRALNGYTKDTGAVWETGVNPRLTVFPEMGHVVQWPAASRLELTDWAYSKINDGNKYPVVYFRAPRYKQVVKGSSVSVEVEAADPDGAIASVDILVNGKQVRTLTKRPYRTTVQRVKGSTMIEARAFDDKGKFNTAMTIVQNGTISSDLLAVPTIPSLPHHEAGPADGTGFAAMMKNAAAANVTNARNHAGKALQISVVQNGQLAHSGRGDDEVTFSNTGDFEGLTLIRTDVYDSSNNNPHLEFAVDEDVTVYVAYEKKDKMHASSIPAWLKEFRKEIVPQIVTQYYYYDLYSKEFPRGKVSLPDALEQQNNVSTNYFVMVKKRQASTTASSHATSSATSVKRTGNVYDIMKEAAAKNEKYGVFMRNPSISSGVYSLKKGDTDGQSPHTRDEIYYIISGKAKIVVGAETHEVSEGSLVFVEAYKEHRFIDVTEDLSVLVFFSAEQQSSTR
ncbi:MAG TPA: cupin domain-containing protein, partial [Chitinophagaceae bacterium]|nr:cupin domain-containing protein [Chitinophagaceae bacterium]